MKTGRIKMYLRIVFDRAAPNKGVLEVLHQSPVNFVDEALDSPIVSPQNNRFIIVRKLALWFSINTSEVFGKVREIRL